MLISVHPNVLGVSKYLVCDTENGSYSWSSICPVDSWVFGDPTTIRSLDVILKMSNIDFPKIECNTHIKAFRTLLGNDVPSLPWHKILPAHMFQETIQALVTSLTQALESFNNYSYGETFISERAFLLGLSRAHIDMQKLTDYMQLENNPTVISTLRSFTPASNKLAKKTIYDQAATSTGRLTVESGPMILTLPKKYKDLIKSQYEGGEVMQLDFISLEPRIARHVSGASSSLDVYESMSRELFEGLLSREQSKIAVLCALYGVSAKRLQAMLGNKLNAVQVIQSVKRYFGVPMLVSSLKASLKENGYMTNFFGRKLVPDRLDENILVNHYIQSTAADVALVGFQKVMRKLKEVSPSITPLFVIHDAILLDVPGNYKDQVKDIVSKGIDIDGIGAFPLGLEVIRH